MSKSIVPFLFSYSLPSAVCTRIGSVVSKRNVGFILLFSFFFFFLLFFFFPAEYPIPLKPCVILVQKGLSPPLCLSALRFTLH